MVLSDGALRAAHTCGNSRCRVLQYVHNSLMVGCESDGSLKPSKGVVAYGGKEDLLLNAMVALLGKTLYTEL